ncbi:MAG: hypothetical protein Q9210_002923 [Variospora velana]
MAQDELARQWRAYEGYAREEFQTWADHCKQYPEDWRLLWRTLAEQRNRQEMRHLWRKPYVVPIDLDSPRYGGGISPEVPDHDSVAADLASEVGSYRAVRSRSDSPDSDTKPSKRQRKPAKQKKRTSHKPAGVSATSKVTKSTKSNRGRLRSTALVSAISASEDRVLRPRTRLQAKRTSERPS